MNITLTVVVAAIVILITALVVITIFGSGMTNVGSLAQAKAFCETQCATSCRVTGEYPTTWTVPNIKISGDPATYSCATLEGVHKPDCSAVCPKR